MAAGHAKDARHLTGKGCEKVKRMRGWTVAEKRCQGLSRDGEAGGLRAIAEEAKRERERERTCTRNRHLKKNPKIENYLFIFRLKSKCD